MELKKHVKTGKQLYDDMDKSPAHVGIWEEKKFISISGLTQELKNRIAEIKSDDRYPTKENPGATIQVNAPLALIQLSMESAVSELQLCIVELQKIEEGKSVLSAMRKKQKAQR